MIASVGNTGETDGTVEYPAAFEEVVGVGSVNEKIERSVFSATGEEVELAAPGENIPLTSYWGMLTVGSGTSYAAPHVTAIAALLWARDGQRSSDSIRGLLQKSARDLGEKEEYGYGLVDYEYATEIYDEYMELYQEGGVENINEEGIDGIKENDRSVTEYEVPEMVQGSWRGDQHYGLVENLYNNKLKEKNMYTSEEIEYIKAGSIAPDRKIEGTENGVKVVHNLRRSSREVSKNNKEYCDVLHARKKTNYVAAVNCLFNAAIIIKNNKNTEKFHNEAKKFFERAYFSSEQSEEQNGQDVKALEKALYVACYYKLYAEPNVLPEYVEEGVGSKRASLQLLGMAIHVAGDAYAHRQIIPARVGRKGKEYKKEYKILKKHDKLFKNFDMLMKTFEEENVITSGLRNYAYDDGVSEDTKKRL